MYTKSATFTLCESRSQLSGVRSTIVALFCDLRAFSGWCEKQDLKTVADLMQAQIERVVQICNDHHHHFHKFLGDGFVLIWEPDSELGLEICVAHALDAAFHLHRKYWYLANALPYEVPEGYGVGISIGEAIRIQPETFIAEMNEVDFVGYPLNCAARLQGLAAAYGTVVCSRTAKLLSDRPEVFLHPAVPGFRRLLDPPGPRALEKASAAKGLKQEDREGFRYLRFYETEQVLWRASGHLQ